MYYIMWFFGNLSNGPAGIAIDVLILVAVGVLVYALPRVLPVSSTPKRIHIRKRKTSPDDDARAVNGNTYEDFVSTKLSNAFNVPVYNSLEFFFGNKGYSYEIDAAFVTRQGIVCVECKSHSDNNHNFRYVGLNDPDWGDGKDKSPVQQNIKHIDIMRRYLPAKYKNVRIINLVCENVATKIKIGKKKYNIIDDFLLSEDVCIMSMRYTTEKVATRFRKTLEKAPALLNDNDIQALNDFLSSKEMSAERKAERTAEIKRNAR